MAQRALKLSNYLTMLLSTFSLLFTLVSSIAASHSLRSPQHARHLQHHRRATLLTVSDPANLSKGSLTTAGGCTAFYTVPVGDWCFKVAADKGITLDEFYALNTQVDRECSNLWAGYEYCVAGVLSTDLFLFFPLLFLLFSWKLTSVMVHRRCCSCR